VLPSIEQILTDTGCIMPNVVVVQSRHRDQIALALFPVYQWLQRCNSLIVIGRDNYQMAEVIRARAGVVALGDSPMARSISRQTGACCLVADDM